MIQKLSNDYIPDFTSHFELEPDSILWSKGLKYLLFTGVTTNMCVETTARDAADRGVLAPYMPIV